MEAKMQNYKKQNKWMKKINATKVEEKKSGIKPKPKLQGVSVFSKEDGYYHGKYYGKYEGCFGIAICLWIIITYKTQYGADFF